MILQGAVYTEPLALTATGGQVANALTQAATQLPTSGTGIITIRECTYFAVAVQKLGSNTIKLTIQFLVENTNVLSPITVFENDLHGEWVS